MPARPRSISRDGGGYFSFDRSDGSSQAVHQGVTDGSATIRPELGKLPHFRSVKRLAYETTGTRELSVCRDASALWSDISSEHAASK
jgi:hypothetical protein